MNRRTFLPSLILLGVPKTEQEDLNSCFSSINLTYLINSLNKTVRFEMSEAQYSAWTLLKAECGLDKNDTFSAGMCHSLPISLNPKIPKNEIWLVAFDGTVMSKIINLALPVGF